MSFQARSTVLVVFAALVVLATSTARGESEFCKCWKENITPGNPNPLKQCVAKYINLETPKKFRQEEVDYCAKRSYLIPFCLELHLNKFTVKFMEGYANLSPMKDTVKDETLSFFLHMIFKAIEPASSSPLTREYNCISLFPLEIREILPEIYKLVDIGKPANNDIKGHGRKCMQALTAKREMFEVYRQFESLLDYLTYMCKYPWRKYPCKTVVLLNDLARVYVKYSNDEASARYLCDAMRLRLILSDVQLTQSSAFREHLSVLKQRGNGYNKHYVESPQQTLESIEEILKRSTGFPEKLKIYADTLPIQSHDNWAFRVTKSCRIIGSVVQNTLACHAFDAIRTINKIMASDEIERVKIVETSIDYNRYFSIVYLKMSFDERFDQLATYFTTVNKYNEEKASKTLAYIKRRLKFFEDNLKAVARKLGNDLGEVLVATIASAAANLVQKTMDLAMTVAAMFNPFAWLSGANKPNDFWNKLNSLMSAIQDVITAADLYGALQRLTSEAKEFQTSLAKNLQELQKMYDLLSIGDPTKKVTLADGETFLAEYGSYQPAIHRSVLKSAEAQWRAVIDKACALLDKTQGIGMATITVRGKCVSVRGKISEMFSLYDDIYDFQNEFREACANYMRERIALETSRGLQSASGSRAVIDPRKELTDDQVNMIARINYKLQVLDMIENYCDTFEYLNSGQRAKPCVKGITDISSIIHLKPMQREPVHHVIDIPALYSNTISEDGLDVLDIIHGKDISFQIPNFDWLKAHGRFYEGDRQKGLYVKRFALFLPVNDDDTDIVSEGKVLGTFKLFENGPKYSPTVKFWSRFHYRVGRNQRSCHNNKKANPYNYCKDHLPRYCPVTETAEVKCDDTPNRAPFPSVYAKWSFKVSLLNKDKVRLSMPTTKLPIKGLLILCKTKEEWHKHKERSIRSSGDYRECCKDNNYWNATLNSCTRCPDSSHSELNGFCCQMDEEQ